MSGWVRIAGLLSIFSFVAACASSGDAKTYTAKGVVLGPEGEAVGGVRVVLYLVGEEVHLDQELTTERDGKYAFSVGAGRADDAYGLIVVHKAGLAWNCLRWAMLSDFPFDIRLVRPEVLSGVVVEQRGGPIAGAEVSLHCLSSKRVRFHDVPEQLLKAFFTTRTDSEGRFRFTTLSADWRTDFVIEAPGYGTVRSQSLPDYPYTIYRPGQAGIRFVLRPEAKIRGVVVSEVDGQPLAGVQVRIGRTETGVAYGFASAVSDRAGGFTLQGIGEGRFWVGPATSHVPEANWVGWPVQIQTKAGQTAEELKLELTRGGLLEAMVVDRQGGPIADAGLTVFGRGGSKLAQGRTDAGGVCRIRLPAGAYKIVDVGKRGYHVSEPYIFFDVEPGKTIRKELPLEKAEPISGMVTDEKGGPVSSVQMTLMPSLTGEVVTDRRGRFTMIWTKRRDRWQPYQSEEFELIAIDLAGNRAGAAVLSETPGTIQVVLKPALDVTGTVVDAQGEPLAGAWVASWLRGKAWGLNVGRYGRIITDRSGRFRFGPVHAERTYEVSVRAPGFEKAKKEFQTPAETDRPFDIGQIQLAPPSVNDGR